MDKIEEVLIALRQVIRATDMHSKKLAKTTGLTAPQILLLKSIHERENERVTIGEIAKDISLSQATVTTILDRLEKRQLLFRERSATDKRKVHARLTEAGRGVLNNAPMPLQDQLAAAFNGLQDWEQSMILASLQRVASMMNANAIDASPVLDLGELDRYMNDTKPSSLD